MLKIRKFKYDHYQSRQGGFTLLELMIGMTIGLFLVLGMSLMYVNISVNRSQLEKTNIQIENGRYAIDLIRREIELAGYWDDIILEDPVVTHADPCETTNFGISTGSNNLPISAIGYAATNTPSCAGTTASDVLLLRRLSTDTTNIADIDSSNTSLYVQTSACSKDFDNPIVVSSHPNELTLKDKDCTTLKPARKLISDVYYVDDSDATLRKKSFNDDGSSIVLVEGIEQLHFEYVIDSRKKDGSVAEDGVGDAMPDALSILASEISNSCAGTGYCWSNVVGVYVYIISKRPTPSINYLKNINYRIGRKLYYPSTENKKFNKKIFKAYVSLVNPFIRKQSP